jgi:arginine decarboxylase
VADDVTTPLADAVDWFVGRGFTPWSTPGHKRNRELVGDDALLAIDAPYTSGPDDLRTSADLIGQAERMAARTFGADWTRFSVHGSTHPNQALCLTAAHEGQQVIVARTSHKSVMAGLVLSGAEPVWVAPAVDEASGLALAVPHSQIEDAFERAPGARAVMLVEPSYLGLVSDIEAIAERVHSHGVPLICDQAWGAHLGFHPGTPDTALRRGADAIAMSTHKSITSFTQGALLHARETGRIDLEKLGAAFDALLTTSPSAQIYASIDRARALMERRGHELVGRAIATAARARSLLAAIDGVRVLDEHVREQPSVGGWDPLRLIVDLGATGANGIEVDRDLRATGISLEGADRTTLIPFLSIADDAGSVDRLVAALEASLTTRRGTGAGAAVSSSAWRIEAEMAMTPREAFFAPRERVSAARAAGRVAAEITAPYPPGIPALAPGELISSELLEELRAEVAGGARMVGSSDPTLETLIVVA